VIDISFRCGIGIFFCLHKFLSQRFRHKFEPTILSKRRVLISSIITGSFSQHSKSITKWYEWRDYQAWICLQADIIGHLYWPDTKSLSMSFPLCTGRLIFSVTCIGRMLNKSHPNFVIDIADWLFQSHILGDCLSCSTCSFPLGDPGWVGPSHPQACCVGRSFGWDRKSRGPVSQQVWHDGDPSLLGGPGRRAWA
jgi:hypothetical protein